MKDFFDKLANAMSFETQVYVFIGVLLVLLLLCFILLIVVGSKCKKLAKKVEKLEDKIEGEGTLAEASEDGAETAEGEEPAESADLAAGDEAAPAEPVSAVPGAEEEVFYDESEPIGGDSGEEAEVSEQGEAAAGAVVGEAVLLGEQRAFNETIENEISALKEKTEILTKNQRKSFDKIKVVRYSSNLPDGTETTGYSIGITNQDNDGIVLTGTEQQDGGTMLIVKSVKGGVSKVPLTPAEDCAVKRTAK